MRSDITPHRPGSERGNCAIAPWLITSTFHGCQVIHGQLQILPSPEHAHRMPLIIVQILTRKYSLWTLACRTVQTWVKTYTRTRTHTHTCTQKHTHSGFDSLRTHSLTHSRTSTHTHRLANKHTVKKRLSVGWIEKKRNVS